MRIISLSEFKQRKIPKPANFKKALTEYVNSITDFESDLVTVTLDGNYEEPRPSTDINITLVTKDERVLNKKLKEMGEIIFKKYYVALNQNVRTEASLQDATHEFGKYEILKFKRSKLLLGEDPRYYASQIKSSKGQAKKDVQSAIINLSKEYINLVDSKVIAQNIVNTTSHMAQKYFTEKKTRLSNNEKEIIKLFSEDEKLLNTYTKILGIRKEFDTLLAKRKKRKIKALSLQTRYNQLIEQIVNEHESAINYLSTLETKL